MCAQLWFLELITEFCHFYFHPNRALPLSVLNRPWGIFKSENHPEGGFLHRCAMNSYLLTKQVISVSEEILPKILNLGSSKALVTCLKLPIFSLGFSCGVHSPHFSSHVCIWCSFPKTIQNFWGPALIYLPSFLSPFCI